MIQGQFSRISKIPKTPKFCDKDIGIQRASKMGKYGTRDSIYSDIATSVPSGDKDLSQDNGMVPRLNYPIEDALHQDYGPDFLLPELSGVTVNEPSNQDCFALMDKRDHCNQIVKIHIMFLCIMV